MKVNNMGFFSDELGNQYEVLEIIEQKYINNMPLDGVIRSYKTACGVHLNKKNNSFFTVYGDPLTSI